MCPETESDNAVLVGLVQSGQLLRELRLGNVRAGRVEDIENELTASQQTVGDKFARAQGDGC